LRGASFAPDNKSLATVSYHSDKNSEPRHAACLWDLTTGQPRHWLPVHDPLNYMQSMLNGVAFAPDGHSIVTLRDDAFEFWDANTGRQTRRLVVPRVGRFRFSRDGRTLVTGGDDREPIRLWELATGSERHRLSGHTSWTADLTLTPDRRQLISAHADSTVLVWDLAPRTEGTETPPTDDLRRLWADLAAEDASRGYRAVWQLAGADPKTVSAIAARLRPSGKEPGEQVAPLLNQLDDDDFRKRAAARQELESLDRRAEPALRRALAGGVSLEVQQKVKSFLDRQEIREVRAVEALELAGTADARRTLEALAAGDPAARLTREARASLDRLARRPVGP
jgi:hypothetical protein